MAGRYIGGNIGGKSYSALVFDYFNETVDFLDDKKFATPGIVDDEEGSAFLVFEHGGNGEFNLIYAEKLSDSSMATYKKALSKYLAA